MQRRMWKLAWGFTKEHWVKLFLLPVGVAFIAAGVVIEDWTKIPGTWAKEASTGMVAIGTASGIAGLLALTVNLSLKKEIARDVFQSVMGWVTPERLQSELESVYRQRLFAVATHMTVTLTDTPAGYIRMMLDIQRTFRNESSQREDFRPTLGVRNWGEPGRESEVLEISAQFKDNLYTEIENTPPDKIKLPAESLRKRLTTPIPLAKNDEVKVFYKGYEDKLRNDIHYEVFLRPTLNPIVTVVYPVSVSVYLEFHSIGEPILERESQTDNTVTKQWRLNGVMLPSQAIAIRWWPKDLYGVKQHTG